MSEWKEVVEGDHIFFINDDLGNIIKVSENLFISMMPKVVKLGPFSTLEEAQKVLEDKKAVDTVLEEYNHSLLQRK